MFDGKRFRSKHNRVIKLYSPFACKINAEVKGSDGFPLVPCKQIVYGVLTNGCLSAAQYNQECEL